MTCLLTSGLERGLRAERELRGALARRAERTALDALDALLTSTLAAEAVDRVLASQIVRDGLDKVLAGPLVDETVARLLRTDALWQLVDEIARSPSVAAAITQQSTGLMDEVADNVRTRTRTADDRLESRVRRAFGRKPRPLEPGEDPAGA